GTPGVKTIRSASGFGFSMVFVIFRDEYDYYWARSRVLERMNVAVTKLPAGVAPVLGPDATALGQVYWYTLEAEGIDLAQLRSLQDWYVRYQLQSVEGVSEVASVGGFVKQYQIDVHPDKLRAHRVTLPEVYEAVRKSNIDVGAKVVENAGYEFFIRGVGFVKSVADVENIVMYTLGVDSNVMSLAGIAIAIGDVADMGVIMTENIYRRVADEPRRPHAELVYEAATEVSGAIVTAVSNTIVSFIPVFALTDQEGKLFKPLAYTKTFAISASVILALTLVPVLCRYLLRPTQWPRRRSLLVGALLGAAAMLTTRFALAWQFDMPSVQGWPTSIAVGLMVFAAVYRMGRERLLPLDENPVARAIAAVYRPSLSWVLHHKPAFLSIPVAITLIGFTVWLGFSRMSRPLQRALNAVGLAPEESRLWQTWDARFPGIGREFMPPLDEGSFL
ncbi:MAG: efflux RND transporter permease subunit, partial [Planctomycetaceae bacterium]